MMDSKKQKKLPDDTYVMLDVSEDVATQVRALVRELECEDLFRTDKVLNAWDRFIIQFYNDNVPELADSLFNYLMRDIPDEYFDAFSRIYWDNRDYILSSFKYEDDYIGYFDVDYLDFDLGSIDLEGCDPLDVLACFYDKVLFVMGSYITDIMNKLSDLIHFTYDAYIFVVADGEIVDVEFNERFIDGEGMMDLSERSLLEKLDEIKNPFDMNRRMREICSTDMGREEALRMSYFFDCVNREVKVDILKYTFDFLCRLAPDETASYYISKARDHMFEIYQIE